MAIDKWNGSGNWTGNPTDWSTGLPPGSTDIAEIQSGNDDLTTTTSVKSIIIDSGAELTADTGASLTTTRGINNVGTFVTNANSTVTVGGTLTNSGTTSIGNGNGGLSASTTVTAAGLHNTGSLILQGNATSGTTDQATLDITAAAPTTTTGSIRVSGDAMLEFASGGIKAIGTGASLELDGSQARVSIGSGTTSTALSGLASNAGTLTMRGDTGLGAGGASVTTTTGFANAGTLGVDSISFGDDGSTLTLGGTLTNSGAVSIGNTGLSAAMTVTATGLDNSGILVVQGNAASGATNLATLDITVAAPTTWTGAARVSGDALLEFKSGGITAIGHNAFLELDGAEARVSIGSGTTSSALTGLASNAGTLLLRGDTGFGAGGSVVTTTTSFTNTGTVSIDAISFGDGGSTLTLGGTLTNSVSGGGNPNTLGVTIGNTGLSAATTVTAKGLTNNGSVILQGNNASGATQLATLDITAAAAKTTTGFTRVGGDAMLEFASGAITAVGFGSWLELDGAEARISIGNVTTSTALTKLASNAGTFMLLGDTGFGAGGSVVTTTTSFTNTGTVSIDAISFGDGGSTLTLGGTLTNSVSGGGNPNTLGMTIGNTGLSAATTVTAKGLTNNGSVILEGNNASGATQLATLNITGAATATATGFTRVSGDAMLEFKSGGITAIASGSWLELDGAEARISIGNVTTSTALTKLASNAGSFVLRGDTGFGAGGSVVTTTTSFSNTGTVSIDGLAFGDGGSTLTLGGTLTNSVSGGGNTNGLGITIGNTGLSAATTVTATGLTNNGSIILQGNNASGATQLATLNITGAAPATATGFTRVSGDALLEFKSGGITAIGSGSWLELDGAEARISIGSGTTSTALSTLSNNEGTLMLRGGTGFGAGGSVVTTTTGFTNSGTLSVDALAFGDGGSALTFGGTLTNSGTVAIGNTGLSAATTVTAAGFDNSGGTLTLSGDASHLAEVVVNGDATNDGSLSIGASTEFDVAGGHTFFQDTGTTTVVGLLAATTIDANGGVLDFTAALTSGNGTGAINIGADGTAQFDASVDSSHTVTFAATTGTLKLTAPGSFAGTIAGFGSDDVIDLVSKQVTGLSYSGNSTSGVLTVTGSSGTIATLAFSGNYTTASFTAVSDGNGGTDIIDPPSGHALLANYTASSFTTAGDRHGGPLVSEPQQNLAAG